MYSMAVFGCLYTDMITRGALLPALTLVAIMYWSVSSIIGMVHGKCYKWMRT